MPAGFQELPGFGVGIPPAPKGFEAISELASGFVAAEIVGWRRATANKEERIILMWTTIPMLTFGQPGMHDAFRGGAASGFGVDAEVKVPHDTRWPTLRFERKAGGDSIGNVIRKETVAVNNLAYVLSYEASSGDTPEGRAAFDAIAAGLHFEAPATLGESLRVDQRRIGVPGKGNERITICLPEPFRVGEREFPSAVAFDLTMFTHRQPPELSIEDFTANLYFRIGGKDPPENWEDVPKAPVGWGHDGADLRIAKPIQWKQYAGPSEKRDYCAFMGARRLEGDQWLWIALKMPQRIVDQAGGDEPVLKVLEQTLRSAQTANRRTEK